MLDHTDPVASIIPAMSLDSPSDNAMTALSRLALGPVNTDYYLAVFERFDSTGRTTTTWNWAACLATLNWMVFRQLWGAALVYVAAAEGLALIVFGIGRSFLNWPPGVELGVLGAFAVLAFAVPGLYGNAILYADIRKRIARALAASRTVPEACALLEKQASSRKRLQMVVLANGVLGVAALIAYLVWSPSDTKPLALEPAVTVAQATAAATAASSSAATLQANPQATGQVEAAAAAEPAPAPAPEPTPAAASEPAAPLVATSRPGPAPAPAATQASAAPAQAPAASKVSAPAPSKAAPPSAEPTAAARPASATASKVAASSPTPGKAAASTPSSRTSATASPTAPAASTPAPRREAASRASAPAKPKAPATAASDTPAPTVGTAAGYYINVGLFAEEANARKTQARLLNEGLPAFRQELNNAKGRRIRVRVGPYDSRAQADAAAESIRAMALEAVVFKQP